MLGKLARWLRVLGFDVTYFRRIEDGELLTIARKEGRTLLTRDTELIRRAKAVPALLIASEKWEEQVVQVLKAFELGGRVVPFSRCLDCNRPLKILTRGDAGNLVPPFILDGAEHFALCPECGRVFWEGTHAGDMGKRIDRILKKLG